MIFPQSPALGQIITDVDKNKDWIYTDSGWKEMVSHSHEPAIKTPGIKSPPNTFGYRDIYSQGTHVYAWQVMYQGENLSGTSGSIRQAYRDAKKEVRRFKKMYNFLNK